MLVPLIINLRTGFFQTLLKFAKVRAKREKGDRRRETGKNRM